tara:strand:+ start:700 stop:1320 length:621 start_codon:yes stop_codon:yes gene_type:complete
MYNKQMTAWLVEQGVTEYTITEGTSSFNSLMWLLKLIKDHAPDAQKILEIGLNLGHSSDAILEHTNAKVVSFDLKQFGYSELVKNYFSQHYPDRHTIIWGDSTVSIPNYNTASLSDPEFKFFDVIFIDGCHDYEVVKADLENCRELSDNGTLVILDDIVRTNPEPWNEGPTRAWEEMVAEGKIEEIENTYQTFTGSRGLVAGRYVW